MESKEEQQIDISPPNMANMNNDNDEIEDLNPPSDAPTEGT